MLKDHFQKYIGSLNVLRSEHFKTSEYLAKGKYKLKQKFFGKGKKHYDFDLNSQEFFHEYVDDIIFEQPEIQEIFYNKINHFLENPLQFQNKTVDKQNEEFFVRKNPSEVRAMLQKYFKTRINDLNFKKYKINLRLHNIPDQLGSDNQKLNFLSKVFRSRLNLIEKEVQQCLNRQSRLSVEDYFEESYTIGGKPVPVNQNGQPIYKYLDEEECWFSNISREDIQVFSRWLLYSEEVLKQKYWPIYYESKSQILINGLEMMEETEKLFIQHFNTIKQGLVQKGRKLIGMFEKDLQDLSPGNLQQKQNINNFVFNIMGVNSNSLLQLPIIPALKQQLCENYTVALQPFFRNLLEPDRTNFQYKQIISMIPKLNNFCSIMFKYQNQQILEGEQQIKLGLQDDVDMKKELVTMLEQLWVRNHIKINYERFQYKLHLKTPDFQLDRYSKKLERYRTYKNQNGYQQDPSLVELMRLARMVSYNNFRKSMKRRAQKNISRLQTKYFDMELLQKYADKSDEEVNMEKLNDLYRAKMADLSFLFQKNLKQTTEKFLKVIIHNHIYSNPTQLQILETIKLVRVRELRTKIMSILNASRCYQRNIIKDLNVINNCDFQFQMDDSLLINSNKQIIQKYQKQIKDNETVFSRVSKAPSAYPTKQNQTFLLNDIKIQKQMLYKRDKVIREQFGEDIPHFLVQDGKRSKKKVLYDSVLNDLLFIEDRLLETGTYYINFYERVIKMRGLGQVVDRVGVLEELFDFELKFQYEKINLIEKYYYIYENTVEPVNAHKVAKIIMDIIYKSPQMDLSSKSYTMSYNLQIQQLRNENKIVERFIEILKSSQVQKNKQFHKLFAKMQNIPLTLWGFIYGDLQTKTKNYSKLQRMNSISSKISRNSDPFNTNLKELRNQIKEEFGEDSEESEESLKIEEYDEYMLRKNMDDIFEDIVGDGAKDGKQKQSNIAVSSLGLQNMTLNPRFEGGPYPLLNYLPEISLTSDKEEKMLNFMQYLCWAINLHYLIDQLMEESRIYFGNNGKLYQLSMRNKITEKILRLINTSNSENCKLETFHEFETDDPYLQTVIKSLKNYEETMAPILDPPSSLQLSLPSTHERHQATLPPYASLQHFDISTLRDLVRLKKPINIAQYRQLNLGINFIEFLRLREKISHMQIERECIFQAYQKMGKKTDNVIEKYTHCYSKIGNTQTFLSTSETKLYEPTFIKYPVYNSSIDQLRQYFELEKSDLKLFKECVRYYKLQLETDLRILSQIDNLMNGEQIPTIRYLINFEQIILSRDLKTMKNLRGRVKSHIGTRSSQILRVHNFLKYKSKIKNIFQLRIKDLRDLNVQSQIDKIFLGFEKSNIKFSKVCYNILEEKLKSLLILEEAKKYRQDLQLNCANLTNFRHLYQCISTLSQYSTSLPYLSEVLYISSEHQQIYKKIFYDQKSPKNFKKNLSELELEEKNLISILNRQELLELWSQFNQTIHVTYLQNIQIDIPGLCKNVWLPPESKDDIFKWMFKIPNLKIKELEKQAIRHLLKIGESYCGRISFSQYSLSKKILGSKNKFMDLLDKYQKIIEYIQASLFLVSLHLEDDIFDSLHNCILNGIDFQERYPSVDSSVFEQIKNDTIENKSNISAPCFIYENKKAELEEKLKTKITSRGYSFNKQHWAVLDQILDFIITKVQGFGVIREAILPIKDELAQLNKNSIKQKRRTKKESDVDARLFDYLALKTENIYKIIWLSVWQTHLLKQNKEISDQLLTLCSTIVSNDQPVEEMTSSLTNNIFLQNSQYIPVNHEQRLQEKVSFGEGLVSKEEGSLVSIIKPIFVFLPTNIKESLQNIHFENSIASEYRKRCHNFQNLNRIVKSMRKMSMENRQRIFGNVRHFFEKTAKYLGCRSKKQDNSLAETGNLSIQKFVQRESLKSEYLTFLSNTQIYTLAVSYLKIAVNEISEQSKAISNSEKNLFSWKRHHQVSRSTIEAIDYLTYTIYELLEAYKDSNKIQFSKSQLNLIGKNEGGSDSEYNKLVRDVIFNKLLKEQFGSFIVQTATRKLKEEKFPKNEQKKIQNQSLIPRVHLIASYSSPLMQERKTYISQQYKLAFVQAFINRFRNKVSRVDLLSAGYGFVITVPDLEDCVNFMNKLLFTFTEKQFRHRLDTFSQYYEILLEGMRSRNRIIQEQKSIILHLQEKVNNVLEAEYLSKVSKLLQEKALMEEKLELASQSSNGLEHRVRKAVEIEYNERLSQLKKQNNQLQEKFNQFKGLLVHLFKDTTKNNFLEILNLFKGKVGETLDRKIDLSQSFSEISSMIGEKSSIKEIIRVPEQQQNNDRQIESIEKVYGQEDIQKCKIGEDIIHDPYYVTKLINKMRLFSVFKMGCKRIRYEKQRNHQHQQLTELHQIQDKYIVQSERERILREELVKAHEELSKKVIELDKVRYQNQMLENEKAKMKILINSKERKIETKDHEIEELKKQLETIKIETARIGVNNTPGQSSIVQDQLPKISQVRQKKKSTRKIDKAFLTNIESEGLNVSLYEKFQLSSKDSTWRQKCEQLYLENKKLIQELQKLKDNSMFVPHQYSQVHKESYSLNLRNKQRVEVTSSDKNRNWSKEKKKFPNLSFKYNAMKQ